MRVAVLCNWPAVASMKGPSRRRGNHEIGTLSSSVVLASMKGPSRRRGNGRRF